jgi:hypothetical protein
MKFYWAKCRRTGNVTVMCRVGTFFGTEYWQLFESYRKWSRTEVDMEYEIMEEIMPDTTKW